MKYPKLRIKIEFLDLSANNFVLHPELIKLENDFTNSCQTIADTFKINDRDAKIDGIKLENYHDKTLVTAQTKKIIIISCESLKLVPVLTNSSYEIPGDEKSVSR